MNAFTIENCKAVLNAARDMNNSFNPEAYRERFQQSFNNPGSLSDGPMWNNNFNFFDRMSGIGDTWK